MNNEIAARRPACTPVPHSPFWDGNKPLSLQHAVLRADGLDKHERLLLLVLILYTSRKKRCAWPSQRRLARETRMTRRTLHELTNRLEAEHGLLHTEPGRQHWCTRYRINLDALRLLLHPADALRLLPQTTPKF